MPETVLERAAATVTTCPYCGVGCGVRVSRDEAGGIVVRGDEAHPANFGRLCSKGTALGETLTPPNRLLHPEIGGQRVAWDTALDQVAGGLRRVIDQHGPGAVALYVSGQLLTEDYYVANKLMKGSLASANIDTNSRLCMASAVVAHKRAFGADAVPVCYEDLEQADLIVLVGSNTAWAHPILARRIEHARSQRPGLKVVLVDPRRTATSDLADLHLPLAPGSDAWLFNGLLNHLRREDLLDWEFLEHHAEGFAATFAAARESAPSVPAVARRCRLTERAVAEFYALFGSTERVVTLFSQGINQSSSGVDKCNAIINCHLATGRIGRPGAGPFSITGQPNAMGGREVGGLANQLAAHMDFDAASCERLARFWDLPDVAREPGLKAVDLFEAVERGEIRALWIMATNPAVTLPEADRMRAALARCELVVVSDCVGDTDTAALAHVRLPALTWGEKDGTVTNSERRISRQRAFLPAPGEARADWWIICEVARRMGFGEQFPYASPADIFREHAALSGYENDGSRDFDLSALADLSDGDYDALQPVQWPVTAAAPRGTVRLFEDRRFFTPSGRARLLPVQAQGPAVGTDHAFPFVLNTGRLRDQWHTMTRTGSVGRLTQHAPEPRVDLHPDDARQLGLREGDLARLRSRHGWMLARTHYEDGQRIGSVFVPMHWSDAFARNARVDALVGAVVDPLSGQPESKHTPVALQRFDARWYAFLLSREPLTAGGDWPYQAVVYGAHFLRYEMAGEEPVDWPAWRRMHFGAGGDWLEFADVGGGRYRAALIDAAGMQLALFVAPDPQLPGRDWLAQMFSKPELTPGERAALLSGRPPRGAEDAGPVVCACFGVSERRIRQCLNDLAEPSVEAVGEQVQAGTNCGSCQPEIRRLIQSMSLADGVAGGVP